MPSLLWLKCLLVLAEMLLLAAGRALVLQAQFALNWLDQALSRRSLHLL
jgi:hypothetical protein